MKPDAATTKRWRSTRLQKDPKRQDARYPVFPIDHRKMSVISSHHDLERFLANDHFFVFEQQHAGRGLVPFRIGQSAGASQVIQAGDGRESRSQIDSNGRIQ